MGYCGTANVTAGTTVSGSDLRYANTFTGTPATTGAIPPNYYSEGTTSTPQTAWANNGVQRYVTGNVGYSLPAGTTALSGTWRAMEGSAGRYAFYESCGNYTASYNSVTTFVRIS